MCRARRGTRRAILGLAEGSVGVVVEGADKLSPHLFVKQAQRPRLDLGGDQGEEQ